MIVDGSKPENKRIAFRRGFAVGQQAKAEGAELVAKDIVDHHMLSYKRIEGWRYRNVDAFRQAWIEGFLAGNYPNDDKEIPEGKPFSIHVQEKPEKMGNRNRLRVDALGQFFSGPRIHCNLRPLDETALRYRYERGRALELYASQFGSCTGSECKSCPVAKEKYAELGPIFIRSVV